MKVNIDEENVKRLRLAFYVRLHAEPDADFDEFAETVVNCLINESPLIEFSRKRRRTVGVVQQRINRRVKRQG
jgi:hypothetical protein